MKQQLEQELLASLETVKSYITKTAEFANEQAPLVVEELIRFNLWYSGMGALVGTFFLLASAIWASVFIYRSINETEEVHAQIATLGIIPFVIGAVILANNLGTLIMCLTAPRLFVLEYIKGIL